MNIKFINPKRYHIMNKILLSKSREMTSNVWAMRRRESYVFPLGRFN